MAQQLPLPLPAKPAMGREDFFVSEANEIAVAILSEWQGWPLGKLVLTGEAGAGKTHLAHVWAKEVGGRIVQASKCGTQDASELATTPLVIEDLPDLVAAPEAQRALFHIHNLMAERGFPLLMTSTLAPSHLDLPLKDLQSRLAGSNVAEISPPDEMLLRVVLMKLFGDRHISPAAGFFDYVLPRLPRSFAAARAFVAAMDSRALAETRAIGPRLAADVLSSDLDFADEKQ